MAVPRTTTSVGVLAIVVSIFWLGSFADEGGLSFSVTGVCGSLAATPQQPGWSLASIYYRTTMSAGGRRARARVPERKNPPCLLENLCLALAATRTIFLGTPT
jgi:hypothetical protein